MYEPDEFDWKIITLLNYDGRMPSAEIARRLGNVSARTVTNRINALTEHDIINIRAVVNPENVGYGVMADVFVEVEPGRVREVAQKAAEFPQSSYVACATVFDFVTEKLGKIPGVRRTQSYLLPLKIKDLSTWLPPNAAEITRATEEIDPPNSLLIDQNR